MQKQTIFGACAIVEGFDGQAHSDREIIAAWQYLIDTGAAWSLQGWYGRTAWALIEKGMCYAKKAY